MPILLFAGVLLGACSIEGGEASVALVLEGEAAALSSEQRSALKSGAESILASCNNNSEKHRDAPWWPRDLAEEWQRQLAADRLLVRYPGSRVFETFAGSLEVRELLLPLPPGKLPAQPLTRGERGFVAYSKCSGTLMIEFSCSEPLMPPSYQEYCEQYRGPGASAE